MKFSRLLAVIAIPFLLAACSKVPAGHVGVKVYLLGSDKGVDTEILTPGRYFIGINRELYLFPTFTQNYVWTQGEDKGSEVDESITFQTREGLSVNADVGISYSVDPTKVPQLFQKYRKGIGEITDLYLRNMVRDALVTVSSDLPIESVYGEGKSDLMADVETRVRDQVEPIGIIIERIYWIGNVRLPDVVVTALNAKINATQKAQQRRNEIEQAKAEAQVKIEEARGDAESVLLKARAEAEANTIVAQSLTPDLVRYRAISEWDGIMPRFVGGQAPLPFIDVGQGDKASLTGAR